MLIRCFHVAVVAIACVLVMQLGAHMLLSSSPLARDRPALPLADPQKHRFQNILKFDLDGDNGLDRDELVNFLTHHSVGNWFSRRIRVRSVMAKLDRDKDYRLSMEELSVQLGTSVMRTFTPEPVPPRGAPPSMTATLSVIHANSSTPSYSTSPSLSPIPARLFTSTAVPSHTLQGT
eukprot:TRINITY_DN3378_c0_g1_i2.p1 TRINITY_DN3378_c0_g1~~TRINITY_DN3378_c0_g1_i2.p1  ORF type:complete len:177 (+),score=16.11 TRINITY_DN3378_c0_g1_i2:61-591(+)